MATNWQTPFGLPFAFPPQPPLPPPQQQQQQQQQHQPPRSETQSIPPNPYQSSPSDAFANSWNIPGLNLQAYGQNIQQTQFSPAPLPMSDSWAQMQMPFPLWMQNGMIPPPPLPPGLNLGAISASPQAFQHPGPANSFPTMHTQPARQHLPVAHELLDSDKEEGEVSEGDHISQSPTAGARIQLEPPRSVPQADAGAGNNSTVVQQDTYNPAHPASGQSPRSQSQNQQQSFSSSTDNVTGQRDEAKKFIRLLHANNIGYHSLSAEGLDANALRKLYRSLNLPSEPEPVPPPTDSNVESSVATSNSSLANSRQMATTVKTNIPPTPPVHSAPSPVDRKDYIARLQAAKMAKQNSAPKLTPPQTPPTMAMSKGKVDLPKAPFTNNNGKDLTEEQKKARNTELIRLRMEALKKNSSSPTAPSASATPAIASSPGASVAQTPISVQQAPPSSRNVKKAQNNTISSFGNIPGLFMNSASSATAFPTTPTAENSTPKRPLADTEVAQTPARSVGADAAPHPDPMVVDDYNAASIGASRSLAEDVSSAGHSNPRQRATQNASDNAILLELPSRPASVKPVTSALSTPGPQTPGSIALSQEFEDREKQLAAAKTRARERYKEAKQKAQRLAAAAAAPPKSPSKKQNSIPAKVSEMQSEGTGPLTVVGELPSSKTTSILSDGSRDSLNDSKKRRREEIESGLPTLEAEIASNAAKMAQLVKEMESLNASSERMRKDKERLIQELENLGIDTEGMPHAELQAKKDEIVREQEIAADPDATSSDLPIIEGEIMESRTDSIVKDATQNLFQQPQVPGFVSQNGIPGLQASNQQTTALSAYPSTNLGAVDYQRASSGRPVSSVTGGENTNQSGYVDPTRPISAFEHVTEAISSHKSVTPFDDEEDFYSPEPASMLATIKEVDVGQLKSPSEEGEVAMSESDEGEYEPQESPFFAGHPIPDTDIAKRNGVTVNSLSLGQVQVPRRSPDNEDEDPYEPPDIDQPMLDVQSDLMAEASDSSALQGEIDDGEMDMSTSSSDNSNNSDASSTSGVDEYDPESVTPEKELAQVQQLGNPTVPQLQAESTSPGASTQNPDTSMEPENPPRFVPYESPLKLFKSYRYHPNYSQEVPGGFLSMTFSHQIDPNVPICKTETLGAICNDPTCQNQHFRAMNITGDKLLVQLGTANPGKTPEERQSWNDGLRGVLKNLRQKNSKDPNGIAEEISKYRRQFLQDDTRVINL